MELRSRLLVMDLVDLCRAGELRNSSAVGMSIRADPFALPTGSYRQHGGRQGQVQGEAKEARTRARRSCDQGEERSAQRRLPCRASQLQGAFFPSPSGAQLTPQRFLAAPHPLDQGLRTDHPRPTSRAHRLPSQPTPRPHPHHQHFSRIHRPPRSVWRSYFIRGGGFRGRERGWEREGDQGTAWTRNAVQGGPVGVGGRRGEQGDRFQGQAGRTGGRRERSCVAQGGAQS